MTDLPSSTPILANSTMRMAFLAARPMSMTRPIWAYRLFSKPPRVSPANAPNTAIGVPSNTLNGRVQLSYSADKIRNTQKIANANTAAGEMPCWASFSWKLMPR